MWAVNHAQLMRLFLLEPVCISKESDGYKSRPCEILHQVETPFKLRKNFQLHVQKAQENTTIVLLKPPVSLSVQESTHFFT